MMAVANVPEELPSGGARPPRRVARWPGRRAEEAAAAEAEVEPVDEAPPPPPAAEAVADGPPAEATAAPAAAAPPAPAPAAPPPWLRRRSARGPTASSAWRARSTATTTASAACGGRTTSAAGTRASRSAISADQRAPRWCGRGGHTARVRAVSLMRDEGLVLSGGADCCVRLWSLCGRRRQDLRVRAAAFARPRRRHPRHRPARRHREAVGHWRREGDPQARRAC